MEAISVEQEKEDTGKSSRNGKSKKQRPKSMPEATLAQADEQELLKDKHVVVPDKVIKSKDSQKPKTKKQPKVNSAPFSDTGPQEVVALTETQPEAKKSKGKKPKEKRVGAESKTEATESPPAKKENSKIKKKKTPASEGTFESPILSTSPPPEEEIRVPKQVTVGVIKMKNTKSRPTLEVEGHARSKAYQSDPDGQAQREDDTDDEERKLLQEMATLQLMADGAAAEAVDETPKKKKQGKVRGPLDKADHEAPAETKVSPKAAKKSKQTKGREKPTVESEPVVAESKESKVMKKTKSKGKAEQQLEVVAQLPPQLETATELDKKQAKKVKKSKNKGKSEPEAEATVQVSPQPEVPTEPEKKERKKVKKTKSIGKSESEAEATVQVSPPQPEVPTEPEKKQPKKVKKTKNKEKVEPMPEPEAQPPQVEEATKADKKESKKAKKTKSKSEPVPEPVAQPPPQDKPKGVPEEKKKASKRVTGKGKAEDTDTGLQTPATTAAVEGNLEDVKPKKTKKKTSKSSVAASDSPSLPQQSPANRGSKSKLATKTSTPKIASETSDDLVFIAADKLSKSKTPTVTSKDDTAVGEEPEAMNLSSSSRSTSYHELSKEDRKTFQEELRKASSQHSVDNSDGERGSIKVEIDPNVKVTKSGVVKGGKGSRRPSLQVDFSGGYEQTDSTSPNESK